MQAGGGAQEKNLQADSQMTPEPLGWLYPRTPEIMTWVKNKSQTINRLHQPGVPSKAFLKFNA